MDSNGNLYGLTQNGGVFGFNPGGVAYELTQ